MATRGNRHSLANHNQIDNEIEAECTEEDSVDDNGLAVYHDEIIVMISIAAAILLFLSNFDMSGTVGKIVNDLLFGLFGMTAYIAPLIVIAVVLVYISNRNNIFAVRKCISSIGILIDICACIQLANYNDSIKVMQFYTIAKTDKTGGGLLGGILCKLLYRLFGFGGTLVILILLAVIFAIIITEKMFFRWAHSLGEAILNKIRSVNSDDYEEDDYVEYVEAEEEPPRRRRAQTYTFERDDSSIEPVIDNKVEIVKDEEEIELQVSEESADSSNDKMTQLEKVISKLHDSRDAINLNNNLEIDNGEVFEKEISNKFGTRGSSIEELDIRHLADDLLNGNLDNMQDETTVLTTDIPAISAPEHVENFELVHNDSGIGIEDMLQEDEQTGQFSIDMAATDTVNSEEFSTISTKSIQAKALPSKASKEGAAKVSKAPAKKYKFPTVNLLKVSDRASSNKDSKEHMETAKKLQQTFDSFGVGVTITNISCGPAVTRYEVQPDQGVKVSKITNLADDIKLNLAAADIRIEAPIPGKAAVGIEVPNKGSDTTVALRELIESKDFKSSKSSLAFAVGKDIAGQVVIADIAKMPHLLIAGQTGSGKSVCINTLIMSILYKSHPDDVKLIMIDPKVVELSVYNGIPHLLIPVVTDPKKASGALNWAVAEMTDRYSKFAELGVRDISSFNEKVTSVPDNNLPRYQKLPQIVIIVDELADLMMVAPGEVEDAICRLAQMARAAGLHLIIATQRPSVNVITGLIKANVPSRIAFSVASNIDSRTILDGGGAEKLLGKGDMLFFPSGYPKPVRVQGAYVSDKEVGDVVEFLAAQGYSSNYDDDIDSKIATATVSTSNEPAAAKKENGKDDYFVEAGKFIIEKDKASIGMLQRVYKIGFNRAARIMDQLCEAGVVGPEEGTKPRKILMTSDEFSQYIEECL